MSRNPMSKYIVKDRDDRLRPMKALVCKIVGHRWRAKMYDEVCLRCAISRRNR